MRFYRRVLACLLVSQLLGGCQWLQQYWPWSEHTPPDPAAEQRQNDIDRLLAKGDLAFAKDRLSVPAEDNAILYYRQALLLEPGHKKARDGIARVAARYRDLARTAHGNGDDHLARKYLKRAESIESDSPENRALREQLQSTPKGQKPRALEINKPDLPAIIKSRPGGADTGAAPLPLQQQ